jgi:transcriptional regulator with XRE-family HTH domain
LDTKACFVAALRNDLYPEGAAAIVDPSPFSRNLKALRRRKGVTQEELQRRLGLKRQSQVSIFERSGRLPKPETIKKIAAALESEPWQLMVGVLTPYDELRMSGTGEIPQLWRAWVRLIESEDRNLVLSLAEELAGVGGGGVSTSVRVETSPKRKKGTKR